MTWTAPNTAEAGALIRAAYHNTFIRDNLEHLYANLPKRATMWHDEATVITGNALARPVVNTHAYNVVSYQNASANGDTFTHGFQVGEGTYTLTVLGRHLTSAGRVDWYVDDVLVASAQDWYAGSAAPNITKTVADIVIAEGGWHVLKGVVNGKNGSSSGYDLQLTKYWLKQASDT